MNHATTPSAEFFGDPQAPLFGWLHGTATPADLGVLVCPPLGQEMVNAYRSLQALAQDLAARGLPTLRLDYAGCGNSAEPPSAEAEHGHAAAWQSSIERGIEHLRARTGVTRVALLGLRSGALLAGQVAASHPHVVALVAVAPVLGGRPLLREWRMLQAAAALKSTRGDDALEVAGALFSADTCAQLSALSLSSLRWPTGRALLVLDRDDLPGAARWIAQLQLEGVDVQTRRLGGIADMLAEPQHQVVPIGVVQAVGQYLADRAQALDPPPPPRKKTLNDAETTGQRVACMAAGVREHIVDMGDAYTPLFAIVSEPIEVRADAATLLLPNTGPVHHIGGHRLHVVLARHLAAQGHRVLRLDLSGLGDSPARLAEPADAVYGRRAIDDLDLALARAQSLWPASALQLLGLCAGAYHALTWVARHPGVAQCIVVNPLVYHWREGQTLQDYEAALQAAYYRRKWLRWSSWRRLFSGQSDLRLLLSVAADRLRHRLQAAVKRPAMAAAEHDLNRQLYAAARHGSRLHFVFSEGEPGWPALQRQGAQALSTLQYTGKLQVHHLPQADHTLSTEDARLRLLSLVSHCMSPEPSADLDPHATTQSAQRAAAA